MLREFDRSSATSYRYGVGATRPSRSSPGAPTIASGVAFAFSVKAVTDTACEGSSASQPET